MIMMPFKMITVVIIAIIYTCSIALKGSRMENYPDYVGTKF